MFSPVIYCLAVTENVYRIILLSIFVFCWLSFCLSSYCQYCFSWLWSIFLHTFEWSHQVIVLMRQNCLQCWQVLFLLLFLTLTLSTLSLGCNVLCMVISFLVFWFICLYSLVHFKYCPEYLTRKTAQVFIPLKRFVHNSFATSNFRFLPKYFFLSSPLFWWCQFAMSPSICRFPFLQAF